MYAGLDHHGATFARELFHEFERALSQEVNGLSNHVEQVRYATSAGHRTRPVGVLLATSAVGGEWAKSLGAAVAAEFIHKSSVIRDDIADGDKMRGGQLALHIKYDLGTAIAVSDFLWTRALRILGGDYLTDRSRESVWLAITAIGDMAVGQLEDVAPSPSLSAVSDRLAVEEAKTGALSQLSCELGALLGGGTEAEVRALSGYGRALGTAFQILNDVRNLQGAETSRPGGSDIRNGRDTVLSAYARTTGDSRVRKLLSLSGSGGGEHSGVGHHIVRSAVLGSDAVTFGERLAGQYMKAAREELAFLQPTAAREILEALTRDALLSYAF
jgi:geranylgeranyl pyrophosphate synthase